MTALRDCTDSATWWPHVDEATQALAVGGLVVLPTDTVYGIAADAFKPEAVQALLDAKGRGRQMPPPVLIGDQRTLDGLADGVSDQVRAMVEKHWPGPLTVILRAQPSLQWDLGETHGTVALRMPDHELTLAVLKRTGPLAVSSANSTGSPAATTAAEAEGMLGSSVRVYLDGGTSPGGVASTIVDATGDELRIVREGALSAADLGIEEPAAADDPAAAADEPAAEAEPTAENEAAATTAESDPEGEAAPAEATEATAPTTETEPAASPSAPDAASVTSADDVVIKPRRVRRPVKPQAPAKPKVAAGADEVPVAPRRVRRQAEPEAPAVEPAVAEQPAAEQSESAEDTRETPTP